MLSTNQTQSERSITLWSWLFPITYIIHIAEEYWGGEGYPAYLLRLRGVHLSPGRFLFDQALGLVLVIAGVIIARRLKFRLFMLVILGALVLANGITHTVTALIDGHYGPGLIASILIWIPLGAVTLFRMRGPVTSRRYLAAVAIGFAINGIVALIALRGGRLM
jgi:hypothetical protein